jgi:glycosyltransferase involved in cell wall biosynthesis
VQISSHQEGITRILARKSRRLSSIGGELAARQPFDTFRANDDQATALAFPRAGAGMVRLDPAREIVHDAWWQSARTAEDADLVAAHGAVLGQMSGETVEARPSGQVYRLQVVEQPSKVQQTFESHPNAPQRELTSASSTRVDQEPDSVPLLAPAPAPDAEGWRLRRWLSPSRMLRRLRLFLVRDGGANGITSLLFRRKASAAPASEPVERNEASTEEVLSAEIKVVVKDAVTGDRSLEPPGYSDASWGEAVAVVENAKEPVAAETSKNLSIAEVASEAPAKAKELLGLGERVPVFLFAGEMSYAAGVDILTDALVTVCQGHQDAQFVFVGAGPLKNDMEAQVSIAGFAHRCRFTGDLPPAEFEKFLAACDFVVIPAREGQGSCLSEKALSLGKPVLTTHQAQIRGIVHGHNGLVAYDCANSVVWGLRELLAKPLRPPPQQESVEWKAA